MALPEESHLADKRLVQRFLDGSVEAERLLVERLRCVPKMLAVQNARSSSPLDDAELADAVQEVLILILRSLHRFQGLSKLETWVYQFCYFELRNHVRRRNARRREQSSEGLESVIDDERSPGNLGDLERVERALEELREEEAEVIRLRHYEGLEFGEIARRMDTSANTLKARYYRGIEKLRGKLGVQEEAGS